MTNLLNLIILGPQGSGKGTQAELLAQKFDLAVLGTGAMFREIAKTQSELGKKINQIMNVEGRLVDSELTSEIVKDRIERIPKGQGIILDGFPRTMRQYELFREFWPRLGRGDYHILCIELSEAEAVKRLATRFVCEKCGEIYIGNDSGACKVCGRRLIQRPDDSAEAVRMRLRMFNEQTLPMIKEMEKEARVIRIDGSPSIEEVHREILKKLNLT